MNITLNQILSLVGRLDDSEGNETPRERFRRFLKENVLEVGQIRDYIEDCLRTSGEQYNRALQDLVNYVGHFLGFDVIFGRYHGVQGQIGFDGHWKSPTGFDIVVEVKTSEVYAIKTSALMGYVDGLISDKKIPNWNKALGLYVVGRTDPEIRTLENAIIAEKRTDQLRIISVDSLLSLAEMMNEYNVSHEDILSVIKPSGPAIDSIVELMNRLVVEKREIETNEKDSEQPEGSSDSESIGEITYWLTPVRSDEDVTAEECIQTLVEQEKIYAFGDKTPRRKDIKPGDWICFYANTKGVVAHAKVASPPENKEHPKVRDSKKYPWVFSLENPLLYLDNPVVIDAELRKKLDAFQDRDPNKRWAWYVQATRKISEHDFNILTRK
jgi:hypothetical protein